ncbi:MAG: GNAT family N-acetyltransferase [Chitinophagaceae bacterium]
MTPQWILKTFKELTTDELYKILKLRSAVFVVEQNCVFLDMDDKDQESWHLMGMIEDDLASYVRILPPGLAYEGIPSIGRVVSSGKYRRTGTGRAVMLEGIKICNEFFPGLPIKIGAQFYLKNFYGSLGFNQVSDIYMEDDIEHIHMIRP